MSIVVNTHSEVEEKVLIAFLDSLQYDYKSGEQITDDAFLTQYNKEIDEAEAEIEAGNYVDHDDVEKIFAERRNSLNANKME